MSSHQRTPYHEQVAARVLDELRQGTAPWLRPWDPTQGQSLPHNPVSGARYRGINLVNLMSQGYPDPRWLTYKQAQANAWQVRKGEKGTAIEYWKFTERRAKTDAKGKRIKVDGRAVYEEVRLAKPKVFYATVFNAAQVDGIPALAPRQVDWDVAEAGEKILTGAGADIRTDAQGRAFYRPGTDSIHLPPRDQFSTAAGFYSTALHELGHWTGHPSRLNRDLSGAFGSLDYAREELRAELASLMVSDKTGIPHDPSNHMSYIASWIRLLEDDPRELSRAARDADRIAELVVSLDQGQEAALAQYVARYGDPRTTGAVASRVAIAIDGRDDLAEPGLVTALQQAELSADNALPAKLEAALAAVAEGDQGRAMRLFLMHAPSEAELPACLEAENWAREADKDAINEERTEVALAGVSGRLVSHGEAPFGFRPDGMASYYAIVETMPGQQSVLWGRDLERALGDVGATVGDTVALRLSDTHRVTEIVDRLDAAGEVIGSTTREAARNRWVASVITRCHRRDAGSQGRVADLAR